MPAMLSAVVGSLWGVAGFVFLHSNTPSAAVTGVVYWANPRGDIWNISLFLGFVITGCVFSTFFYRPPPGSANGEKFVPFGICLSTLLVSMLMGTALFREFSALWATISILMLAASVSSMLSYFFCSREPEN